MYYFYTFLCDRRTCSPWVNSCQIYTSEATVLYGNHTHTHTYTHTLHRCSCWSPVTTVSAKPKGTTRSSSLLHARNGQRLRWGRTAKGTAFSKYKRATTPHTETCKQLHITLRLGRPKEWSIGIFSRPPEAIWVHCPCPIMKPINVRIIPFIRHLNQLNPFLRRCVALPLVLPLFSRSSGTSK